MSDQASTATATGPLSLADAADLLLSQDAPLQAESSSDDSNQNASEQTADSKAAKSSQADDDTESEEAQSQEDEEDDDSEAEEEVDSEESDDSDEETEELYTVKIDGEERQVTAQELVKNYQLERASQKRLSEAAEMRKAVEAERTAIQQQAQQYEAALAAMEQTLQAQIDEPSEEYWTSLREEDPLEYITQKEAYREKKERLAAVRAEQDNHIQQALQAEQRKVYERIPEWQDKATEAKEREGIVTFARSLGFTPEELGTVRDARLVDVLRKAYLYDSLQSDTKVVTKKVVKKPKMLKGGQATTSKDVKRSRNKQLQSRFNNTPTIDNAIDLYLSNS
jgi:hypothetical protein